MIIATRGDALRACPWLSYSAPLALCFHFTTNPTQTTKIDLFRPWLLMIIATRGDVLRFASHLPLAFIFRAVGALFPLYDKPYTNDENRSMMPAKS